MLELVIGHNGIKQFVRRRGRFATAPGGTPTGNAIASDGAGDVTIQGDPAGSAGTPVLASPVSQGAPTSADPGTQGRAGRSPDVRSRFEVNVLEGLLRLANRHLAAPVGWLLLLAVMGLSITALRIRRCWPLTPAHLALLLWSGWALTYGLVYSYAGGIFHAYYLVRIWCASLG